MNLQITITRSLYSDGAFVAITLMIAESDPKEKDIMTTMVMNLLSEPPHPEIWINYFLRMVQLYSNRVCELSEDSNTEEITGSLSYLKGKEKELLLFLMKHYKREFTPIEVSKEFAVTNKTIINRLSVLVKNGFVEPVMVNERVRSYKLSTFTKDHEKELKKSLQ